MISNFNNEELIILLNYAKYNPDLYLYIYENLNIKLNLKELCKDDILYFIKFYYPFEFNNFKNNNIIVKDLILEDYSPPTAGKEMRKIFLLLYYN